MRSRCDCDGTQSAEVLSKLMYSKLMYFRQLLHKEEDVGNEVITPSHNAPQWPELELWWLVPRLQIAGYLHCCENVWRQEASKSVGIPNPMKVCICNSIQRLNRIW